MNVWRAGLVVLMSLVWLFPVFDGAWTAVAAADTTAPVLRWVEVSPTTVAAGGTVQVRMHITDDDSGVSSTQVIAGTTGSNTAAYASLESGTPIDGVWVASLSIPAAAHPGPWGAAVFAIYDQAGNRREIGPSDPGGSGLNFTVTGGSTDTTPPTLHWATISPTTVAAGGTVEVRMHLTDDSSGVGSALVIAGTEGSNTAAGISLETGSATDGVWLARIEIPAAGHPGPWGAAVFYVVDQAGNRRDFAAGDPGTVGLNFTVTGGSTDTTPPTLHWATVSPTTVGAGGMVDVRMHLTDDSSGVASALVIAGTQGSNTAGTASLESGTRTDGVWLARIQISAFANRGPWGAAVFYVTDQAGNRRDFAAGDPGTVGLNFTVVDPPTSTPTFTPTATSTTTPTSTVTPTLTATPAPCAPRPPVGVRTSRTGDGRLMVTVSAGLGSVQAVRFGTDARPISNASIDVQGGSTGMRAGFTHTPTVGTGQVTFFVRPVAAGQPLTVPIVVTDGCGEWQTFVGGGSGTF